MDNLFSRVPSICMLLERLFIYPTGSALDRSHLSDPIEDVMW